MQKNPIVLSGYIISLGLNLLKCITFQSYLYLDFRINPVGDVIVGTMIDICGLVFLFVRRCGSKSNV